MASYLLKRLVLALATLLAILFTSYALLRLAPGDPTRSDMLGGDSQHGALDGKSGALRTNTALREKLALDQPILTGFARWLKAAARGDFGESASVDPGRSVTAMILERLPLTLYLNCWAIALTYLLAVPIGVFSAAGAGGVADRTVEFLLFVLYSLPVMWVGLLLQSLFCEGGRFPIFPLGGEIPRGEELSIWRYQWEQLRAFALPVVCLAYGGFAGLSRYTRGSVLQYIHSDFIRTARAKGLTESAVLWKHAFRNALITMITLFSGILPALVGGSVLVEYIFNLPGMGSLSLLALSSRDYPLQMALFTFTAILTLLGILICDLLYMAADPRIRLHR